MDVTQRRRQENGNRKQYLGTQEGFTLIESVVAMGLFVGVVFLLVSVFNEFLMDTYSVKLNKATLIAENEILQMDPFGKTVEKSQSFESVERDTIGFHITQTVTMRERVVLVVVAVSDAQPEADAPMAQKKPQIQYIKLTKAFPAN